MEIGKGANGTVYNVNGTAVKTYVGKGTDIEGPHFITAAQEYFILKDLNHPNVVKPKRLEWRDRQFHLHMDLYDLSLDCADINFNDRLIILRDAAAGLDYLHQNSIIHTDLKWQNILVRKTADSYIGTICDFSNALMLPTEFNGEVQTITHRAPELALDETTERRLGIITEKIDIWSLGITILETIRNTGLTFYFDDPTETAAKLFGLKELTTKTRYESLLQLTFDQRYNAIYKMFTGTKLTEKQRSSVSRIIADCLEVNYTKRPTAATIRDLLTNLIGDGREYDEEPIMETNYACLHVVDEVYYAFQHCDISCLTYAESLYRQYKNKWGALYVAMIVYGNYLPLELLKHDDEIQKFMCLTPFHL